MSGVRAAAVPAWAALMLALSACAPLARRDDPFARRDAAPPLACMRTVVRERVPADAGDRMKHCLADGFIARHCSVGEARVAAWGKEFTDLFDGGDASAQDLRDDASGVRCARGAIDDQGVRSCCAVAIGQGAEFNPRPPRRR